jgi:hypothetical protein
MLKYNIHSLAEFTHEEPNTRLNSGNVWYNSIVNLSSSRLTYRNLKLIKCKTSARHVENSTRRP